MVAEISAWALPLSLAFILVAAVMRKVPLYETFVLGAKDGFPTAISLIPNIIGMMVAVSVFRSSGALNLLIHALNPLFQFLHFPPELLPIALLRPISGASSLALVTDIFRHHGPDSLLGQIAATMQGSTDTTLYVLTVYFGSVGIKNPRYAVQVGLWSDLVGVFASVFAVYLIIGK